MTTVALPAKVERASPKICCDGIIPIQHTPLRQNGVVEAKDRWEKGAARHQPLVDSILGIADNDSLVILKHAELDPVLGPVLEKLLLRMLKSQYRVRL